MYNVKLLNKIASVGTDEFDKRKYNIDVDIAAPEAIMVRSAAMHDMEFGPELLAIARAGAGVNNIPIDKCAEQGIVVFNTPGANANGVKELAIAALLMAARDIIGGVKFTETLTEDVAKSVERGKSAFAGCELKGKTLGVIGLGAIGGMVANAAAALGMKVIGYDPYITIEGAWRLSHHISKAASYEEIFKSCDFITLHVPATPETKNMIRRDTIAMMRDGVRIINLSRADLVCASDVKDAIVQGKVTRYVTDFPTEETINQPGIVTIPHLGASTAESEDNCAVMAAHELIDYIENGNITNSVNYPSVQMPRSGAARLVVLHRNIPNMITSITGVLSEAGLNIENMANRSRGDYACTLLDADSDFSEATVSAVAALDGVIRVLKV